MPSNLTPQAAGSFASPAAAVSSNGFAPQLDHADHGTVLVVDDDEAWVEECCLMLERLGYVTARATTISEAFAQVASHDVSTVIVDYRMPGGDGISLIYALSGRSALRRRKIHFVLATAYPSVDVAISAIRASVVDLLEKPFTAAALNAALLRIRSMTNEPNTIESLSNQLNTLSAEMRQVRSLVEKTAPAKEMASSSYISNIAEVDADLVRKLIRAEQSRSRVIGGKLLGDPAWNILLDLLLAAIEGRKVAVSSACIVAGVATTTALRLVNKMVEDKVLLRIPDETDGRRDFLVVQPDVEAALKSYLVDLAML
ncbi:MAG: response regulator [Sphingomonadales bacterium]|jgi:FixJ family two-component response regulator